MCKARFLTRGKTKFKDPKVGTGNYTRAKTPGGIPDPVPSSTPHTRSDGKCRGLHGIPKSTQCPATLSPSTTVPCSEPPSSFAWTGTETTKHLLTRCLPASTPTLTPTNLSTQQPGESKGHSCPLLTDPKHLPSPSRLQPGLEPATLSALPTPLPFAAATLACRPASDCARSAPIFASLPYLPPVPGTPSPQHILRLYPLHVQSLARLLPGQFSVEVSHDIGRHRRTEND